MKWIVENNLMNKEVVMSGRRFFKSIFPILLIAFLILFGTQIACALLLPPSEDVGEVATFVAATLTALPAEAEAPAAVTPIPPSTRPSEQLDRSDFQLVLRWVVFSIHHNQPEMIAEVIGDHGVQFWSNASGGEFLGYNNAGDIVRELKKGLENSSPQCKGYNSNFGSQPDKAVIYFNGINFNWSDLTGNEKVVSAAEAFQFFRMEQGWELVYITPVRPEIWPNLLETLPACP